MKPVRKYWSRVSPTDAAIVYRHYQRTNSMSKTAAHFGCSQATILRLLRRHSFPRGSRGGANHVRSRETVKRWFAAYWEAKTVKAAAAKLGISRHTLQSAFKQYGWPVIRQGFRPKAKARDAYGHSATRIKSQCP